MTFAESELEDALIGWLKKLGWQYIAGPTIAPDGAAPERLTWGDVVLRERLRRALTLLNPELPAEAIEDSFRKVTVLPGTTVSAMNRAFHQMLTDGIPVEYKATNGRIVGDRARLIDPWNPEFNDLLAVNQMTIVEGQHKRRPDVVLFVNGLPLAVIELKRMGDENATIRGAWNQLQTYREQIPTIFGWNEVLVISDGTNARIGTTSSGWERFMPWKTVDGTREHEGFNQLEVLTKGVFEPERFLDLVTTCIVFEVDGVTSTKKMAAYHQFWAVRKAVEATIEASSPDGDRRVGVVWHTQGSGKSLSMVFYVGKLIRDQRLGNPTLVVLTDRNDLDNQLLGAFALAQDLIPGPRQADSRDDLKSLLAVPSGGVIFTTVQKFGVKRGERYPTLSDRRNIIVITDEAHRSQYDFIDGFARHLHDALPNASYIGFTGTPIESGDKITRNVFGDYIDVYDIAQAVADGATVPIYYESRLIQIDLDPDEREKLDREVAEVTEAEEEGAKRKASSKWARVEAVVGTQKRLKEVAADVVEHYENRQQALDGKALVVCMSRRICVDLYSEIVAIRPDWHSVQDGAGTIKVVMTGSASDPPAFQQHIRNSAGSEAIKKRLKDPDDSLKMVIVRDMWLTGFDAPALHTMYIDKLMRGHTLMQAIARVNRVFAGKPGGLVVDYLGLGQALRAAVAEYTKSDGKGDVAIDLGQAVVALIEKLEIVRAMIHPFDYSRAFSTDPAEKYQAAVNGLDTILGKDEGEGRFLAGTNSLLRAFKLAGATPEALRLRDEVAYFLGLRGSLMKITPAGHLSSDELDFAMSQIVSRAVVTSGVIDIFGQAGIDTPDISLVSDDFLREVREMPQKNLAAAALERLLRDEIKVRRKHNVVEARKFSEMLDVSMRKYHNRAVEAAQVLLELVEMAKEFRQMAERGHAMNLTDDELAFYDALATNGAAMDLMGDETLRGMARELAAMLRNSVTVDWAVKESVRAELRLRVKRLLRKYKYPPDQQEAATALILQQTEVLADLWGSAA